MSLKCNDLMISVMKAAVVYLLIGILAQRIAQPVESRAAGTEEEGE